jgi:hypothetical protein
MKEKEYKAIFVPKELHYTIKVEALKRKQTMMEFIRDLVKKYEKIQSK